VKVRSVVLREVANILQTYRETDRRKTDKKQLLGERNNGLRLAEE